MRLIWRKGFFWVLAACAVLGPFGTMAQDFTREQATAGRQTYRQTCAVCHGAQLEGLQISPALAGDQFDQTWRGKSAAVLSFHVRRMPPEAAEGAGTLSDTDYTNLVAYILTSNGFEAGDTAMSINPDALAGVNIPKLPGQSFDPLAPIDGGADSPLLKNLKPATDAVLKNPSPEDWMQWGRTYDGQRFSPLDEINRETVSGLNLAWRAPLRSGSNFPTPIVYQGVMFLHTYPDTVLAMDATNGKILWRHEQKVKGSSSAKMGISIHDDKVLVPTSDLHVIALNAKTGKLIWDHEITTESDRRAAYNLRSAPLVVGDKVIQGMTASFAPKGGFIVAMDLNTGDEVWRFNTIARPDDPNGETWNDVPMEKRSGGSVWHQGTYDAELGLIYYGIAPTYDTGPLVNSVNKEGVTSDAYYTNCTVAIDVDTGKLVWYYQHISNDQWDLDWAFERQIAKVEIDGKMRKIVMNAGKMAILEALDAATGEYLFSVDPGVQNVITAIDSKTGAKTINMELWPDVNRPCVVCPTAYGSRSWPLTTYSPQTKLAYLPLTEWCMLLGPDGMKLLTSGVGISDAEHPDNADGMLGKLQAIDIESGKLAWTRDQVMPPSTGLISTAGGLLFSGDMEPSLKAFDAATGKLLWRADLDDIPSSNLMTYGVDGRQYVAVVVGVANLHIRGLTGSLNFSTNLEVPYKPSAKGGAAVWVFALD
ncbi:MAG: PQQ-binding-like beta-propeller repeat protein [Candidatus Hydrogenedentota bacterium]